MKKPRSKVPEIDLKEPAFIVGAPRSGTTLISVILDAHSQIAILPETHYFTKYWKSCRNEACLQDPASYRRFIQRLLDSRDFQDLRLSIEEHKALEQAWMGLDGPDHGKVFACMLNAYRIKSGKPRVGEKTPGHIAYVPYIADLFPDAKFIYMLRDPRDVFLSWTRMPGDRGNAFNFALRWRWYVHLVESYKARGYRLFVIRFEDLLTGTESTLRKLCRYLELPFEPGILSHEQTDSSVFDSEREPWKKKSLEAIDASNINKWRTELGDAELAVIQMITKTGMEANGYEVSSIRPTLFSLAAVFRIVLIGGLLELRKFLTRPGGKLRRLLNTGEKPA